MGESVGNNIVLRQNETMDGLVERLYNSASLVYGIAPVAYWHEELDEKGRLTAIHFSDHMREMLGYKSEEEFPNELNAFVTFLHPDDVDLMLKNAIAAGTGKIDKYELDYRIRRADGNYMWCKATGELVKDCKGKTVGMYGAFIDITEVVELKEKQEQEKKTEEIIKGFTEEYDASFCGKISDNSYQVFTDVDAVAEKIEDMMS